MLLLRACGSRQLRPAQLPVKPMAPGPPVEEKKLMLLWITVKTGSNIRVTQILEYIYYHMIIGNKEARLLDSCGSDIAFGEGGCTDYCSG